MYNTLSAYLFTFCVLALSHAALVDVFEGGKDGFACYRIPALVVNKGGELLAFSEGRFDSCDDHGNVSIVLKRSADGGQTWSALSKVYGESATTTIGNPAPVVLQDGSILLPFSRNNQQAGLLRSTDDGHTWQQAGNLSIPSEWVWVATGPPGSMQLPSGRIILPADHYSKNGTYYSHTWVSDDNGATWQRSNDVVNGNECQAVPLSWVSPEAVLLVMRTSAPLRAAATSSDGGLTWSKPYTIINETQCEGSVTALPQHAGGPLLVASTAFATSRTNLTLHTSTDNGRSWRPTVQIYPGDAAYSSLVSLDDASKLGLLFERDNYAAITYTAVTLP